MASKPTEDESPIFKNNQLRIVLVGKTGTGKSAAAKTILGGEYESSSESLTKECAKASAKIDGQKIAVIDTPGLFNTKFTVEETKKHLRQCIIHASPGPHIFLIVIKLDSFTNEDENTVKKIQELFGEDAGKYSMVLFTYGDLLQGKSIQAYFKENKDLEELMDNCNGQYHVFDSTLKERSQVRELLEKIRNITDRNGGSHYTNAMFQEAERLLEAETQKVLWEKEEELRKQREKLVKLVDNDRERVKQIAALRKRQEKQVRALAEASDPNINVCKSM